MECGRWRHSGEVGVKKSTRRVKTTRRVWYGGAEVGWVVQRRGGARKTPKQVVTTRWGSELGGRWCVGKGLWQACQGLPIACQRLVWQPDGIGWAYILLSFYYSKLKPKKVEEKKKHTANV